jgi:carbon monoxide dehydrogenase subunit G
MVMELRHEFTVPATIEETWTAFNDIESVAACFPGATVSSVEDDTFTGSCKVKLGPIALVYNGTGTFVEKDEAAHRMVIDAKGKDKRGNGTAGAHVTATMVAEGSSTKVEVLTDLNITGKPAQFGRGVMQDVSDKLLGQFTQCLEQKVGGSAGPDAPTADEPDKRMHNMRTLETGTGTSPEGALGAEPEPTASSGPATVPDNVRDMPRAGAPAASGPPPQSDDALDLGATVLPVLAKSYWKQALGVLLVLLVLRRILRRG